MPTIKQVTVYKFAELSDKAKEKAREWWRRASAGDLYFSEMPTENLVEIAAALGWEIDKKRIFWSGFYSQGDGAQFAGEFSAARVDVSKLAAFLAVDETLAGIAHQFKLIAEAFPQVEGSVKPHGHYSHEMATEFSDDFPAHTKGRIFAEVWKDQTRALMKWYYSHLREAYEFEQSNEAVDDNITANEYEFTADGERYIYE